MTLDRATGGPDGPRMATYLVYDVFADAPFQGNPLAVVPEAQDIAEEFLQPIAREFNLSETVFLLPPDDPAHTARLRIFTPAGEIPFAGHPTIGAAVALAEAGAGVEMVLELGVGPLACHAEDGAARFTATRPLEILGELSAELAARCGGLPSQAIRRPPVIASVGLPFVLAELTDVDALSLAAPDIAAFREGAARHDTGGDVFAVMFYVRDGAELRTRMFAPLSNIPEDPATGSAAAALGAYLAGGGALDLTVTQGVEMGRPSRIGLSVRGDAVTVSGQAVRVMEGRLRLPGLPRPSAIG